jgi:hypothetical protein
MISHCGTEFSLSGKLQSPVNWCCLLLAEERMKNSTKLAEFNVELYSKQGENFLFEKWFIFLNL